MNPYTIFEYTIVFYNQRNKELPNVKYSIIFFCEDGTKKTYEGATNPKGQTKPIPLNQNGKLHIFVEGHETIFSPKKTIKPILAEGSNIVEVNDIRLKSNTSFLTKAQYELMQKKTSKDLEELRKNAKAVKQKNFFNLSKIRPTFPLDLAEELNERINMSYEEYRKKNTHIVKKTKYLKFKNYALYRFVDSAGNGIPIVDYQIFAQGQSRPLINARPGPPDKKGYTQLVYTHLKSRVTYTLGSARKNSEWYEPITCVDKQTIYQIIFPTSIAVTQPDINHKENMEARQKPPIVINPTTNEVLILPSAVYAEFDKKTKILSDAVREVHKSNANLIKAIQSRDLDEIKELEKRLNINQEKAIEKINGEFKQTADLREVWVVETTGKTNEKISKYNLKRRYLKVTEYEELKAKRRNPQTEVDVTANQYTVQQPAQIRSSFEKLSQQLLTVKGNAGSDEKAVYNLIGGLGGEIAEEYKNSRDVTVTQEAQWMRMVAGASGEGSISAAPKGVSIKTSGDMSAKWTLFEGVKEWRKFYPCETGWKLEYDNYDLGTIRFLIGAEISGFSGANLGIAGNLSVDISHQGAAQVIKAVVRPPERSMSQMVDRNKKPMFQPAQGSLKIIGNNNQENAQNQGNISINAFAGVQIQGLLKGAVEWFKPKGDGSGEGEFVAIASAAAGGGVSAGVGAQGQFQIGYDQTSGNFKILVAAHLCWGMGAKGVASFVVGTEHLLSYLGFIKSQVAHAGFKTLLYINEAAFLLAAQVLAYCIGENHPVISDINRIAASYGDWIRRLDIDQGRYKTAQNINSSSGKKELLYATPETKGILLYAVTHWTDRTAPIFDMNVKFSDMKIEFFPTRKTAVINIFKTCISTEEWENTIQHIHPRGNKLTQTQLGKVEGDIIRFLNYGNDEKYAEDIIRCLNSGIEYKGTQINAWLQDYLKYRKGAKKIAGSLNYMLVKNQDDNRFKQLEIQQGVWGDSEEITLIASNLNVLSPFDQDDTDKYETYNV
ncbi:hypothetical protein [Acinetobacter baumannii]|jgi:hypothetical protein|uniref:Uncharacterized protein n=2 Tax=Acinetobacter baumannii TaxID=470 RepID=A0A5P1UK01_ACIBA|nr:hypothetical protein [Acinetobacter baumannii]ABO11718.2 hypothetical protein A1S_1290 [Acinetobacter baumannii ATCC 17978]AKQ27383.1 hypothetical protein ACX60_11695 [Acinetobacter baumannii]APP31857.1 hypothetical protein AUO97_13950 [Acinetobacter baumannii]APX50324.1 hypothetical protein AT570_13945 [Acinetobacter baumannii]EHU1525668.1 hypothetical protein [Acinetobacter baumannii]